MRRLHSVLESHSLDNVVTLCGSEIKCLLFGGTYSPHQINSHKSKSLWKTSFQFSLFWLLFLGIIVLLVVARDYSEETIYHDGTVPILNFIIYCIVLNCWPAEHKSVCGPWLCSILIKKNWNSLLLLLVDLHTNFVFYP